MKALRKQTRTSLWKPIEKTSLHEHEYTVNDGEHTCKTCGLVLEFEEF